MREGFGTLRARRPNLVRKKVLSEFERDTLTKALAAGEVDWDDIKNVRLLLDANGSHRSLASLQGQKVCMAADATEQAIGATSPAELGV
jgi:hypothetical protein